MPYARSSIANFELANPLYVGANVAFYTVDVNGVKTATLANLYADTIGSNLLPNPQTLDTLGKFTVPVYIQDPVIGTITTTNSSVPSHDTGIITNLGRNRGAYATTTLYYPNDLIQDPATGYLYGATVAFIASSLAVDVSAGRLVIYLTPADLMAAINAQTQATNAAASAALALSYQTAASGFATAAGASATTAGSSSTTAGVSATNSNASAVAAAASALTAATAAAGTAGAPQGRLSLTAGQSVMVADAINQSTLYYVPECGRTVLIYDGSQMVTGSIGSGLSFALDSNFAHTGWHQFGKLFDVFSYMNSGTPALCTGPAWTSSTARGTGVNTSELQLLNGLWVNANVLVAKTDVTGTTASIPVGRATYLGTFYATANGQTGMQFRPATALGGTNNILGLYNAYNRVLHISMATDSTPSWVYAAAVWRSSNNSTANSVRWVDGLQKSHVTADFSQRVNMTTSAAIGIGLDSNTVAPSKHAFPQSTINTHVGVNDSFLPQLGLHTLYAMENTPNSTTTYVGDPYMAFRVQLEI